MTTPGGVPNLPLGALTIETIASKLHDMTATAMRERAAERIPSIFNASTGGNPLGDFSFNGVLTQLFAGFSSVVAAADPADIDGPEDLPGLLLDFIESLPVIGQLVGLMEAILGTYDGEGDVLAAIQDMFAPLRKLVQLIAGIDDGFPTADDISDWFDNFADWLFGKVGDVIDIDLSGWQDAITNLLGWWTDIFGDLNVFADDFDVADLLAGLGDALTGFMVHGVGDWIEQRFIQPIISVFTGSSSRTDVASLGTAVGGFLTRGSPVQVSQLQGRIPHTMIGRIPVSSITEVVENLLDPFGGFDLSTSVAEADGWLWDDSDGYGSSTGSARLTLDGELHQLFTRVALPVAERDVLEVSAAIKTTSFIGSGTPLRLSVVPFTGNIQGDTVVIAESGQALDWTLIQGGYTVPEGVDSIFVLLEALATAASGTVNWDGVSVVKTGKMRQSLVDKLEDVWQHTTEMIDDGIDVNPFDDPDTFVYRVWASFRGQQNSLIGANATIEQLRSRITALETPSAAIAVDDFERGSGGLSGYWDTHLAAGSADGHIDLDGHHAVWAFDHPLAHCDDTYIMARFLGGGSYGDEYSNTEYQRVTVTVNSGPFKLSANSPALDVLAMLADDYSSAMRARWDGKGNFSLAYLQGGTWYNLRTIAGVAVPTGGTVLTIEVGYLEGAAPDKISVFQDGKTLVDKQLDGSYSVHSYRLNRGWGFGMYARGTPLLGQYGPGSLHQWTANDQ